jgi:F0F1-type ATP synthase assembly protein I
VTDENNKQPTDPEPPQSAANKTGMDQVAKYSELALIMPAGCLGGYLVGAYLDSKFHTHWIFLAGLALGFAGGFAQVIRIAMKSSK